MRSPLYKSLLYNVLQMHYEDEEVYFCYYYVDYYSLV